MNRHWSTERRTAAIASSVYGYTEPDHPFFKYWWPPGHIVGWGDTFLHEVVHLLGAIADDSAVTPYGADFEDGYRASEICEAIVRSSNERRRVEIAYRTLP